MKNFLLGISVTLIALLTFAADSGGVRLLTLNGKAVNNISTGPGLLVLCADGDCRISVVAMPQPQPAMVLAPDKTVKYK